MGKAARVLEDVTKSEVPEVVQEVKVDDKGKKSVVEMSMEQIEAKGWKSKSAIIRGLDAEGYSRSAIAKFLNIRYQHVRNVLITPLKKA